MFGVPIWLTIGFLTLWLAVSALWFFFAIRGLRAVAGKGLWTSALAQISALTFLVAALRSGLVNGLAYAAFPPLLALPLSKITTLAITPQIALIAAPASILTLIACLRIPRLSPLSITLCGLVLLGSSALAGNLIARQAICTAAAVQSLTNVTRNSFTWSIANTGNEFQFDLHAMASLGEDRFAWSYTEMDWFLLPDTVWPNVRSGPTTC